MIIDCHAHVSAPAELWAYKALIMAHRGAHARGGSNISDDELRYAVEKEKFLGRHDSHMEYIDRLGTDMQLISPRPFQAMHSEKPGFLVEWWTEEVNNIIHRQTKMWPKRFVGIAGLPQASGESLDASVKELQRCVKELGFKGCLLNPDPFENGPEDPPALGDRYWYPLYEKLCELDVPALLHGTGSRSIREPYMLRFINEETTAVYGLLNSDVFKDFPTLKIVISHGGGSIPYQLGRFESGTIRRKKGGGELFSEKLKKLYFDTVLYTPEAVEFLLKVVGPERCLFGAECPGVGSEIHPHTHREMDDVAPSIKAIDWLSDAQKEDVLFRNTQNLYKLDLPA
jgi:predicted TIM-barrel fold metal-dependent hydrolase